MRGASQPPADAVSHQPSVCTSGVMAVPDMLPDEPARADQ